jgi:hypothetical protein
MKIKLEINPDVIQEEIQEFLKNSSGYEIDEALQIEILRAVNDYMGNSVPKFGVIKSIFSLGTFMFLYGWVLCSMTKEAEKRIHKEFEKLKITEDISLGEE